jgi:hypothetical protein
MITSIVFSKDRPLQLDLCLKSIQKNFTDSSNTVVLHSYSPEYKEALSIIATEHPNVKFFEQTESIYQDILDITQSSDNTYVCMFTDDNIVYRPINIDPVSYVNIFAAPEVVCISLRLGHNINTRYHHGRRFDDIGDKYQEIQDFVFIPRTSYVYGSYWSYSHSVDGHIFRKSDIIKMFGEIEYLNRLFYYRQTPNEVESQMQKFWTQAGNFMVSLKHSTVVNSPNNRVSDTHTENFSGENFNYEPEFLLGKYVSGKRIDLDLLDFSGIVCPHQEIDIVGAIT